MTTDFEAAGRAISACRDLRYLRLGIPGFISGRVEEPARRAVLSTILRFAPRTIRVLAVRLITRLWASRYLELWDLPEIDDLLAPGSASMFPVLERVEIEIDRPRHKALEGAILPILPKLRAAGLLGVTFATVPLEREFSYHLCELECASW